MQINGVKVHETLDIMVNRVVNELGFVFKHNFSTGFLWKRIYYVNKIKTQHRFLGLFSYTKSSSKKLLGILYKDMDKFLVYNRNNLLLAVMLVKKLSLESQKEIEINLAQENGELVDIQPDDHAWLSVRRKFLEQEQHRIESELADVHKKLQALSGGGSPYRALSAVE